MEGTVVNKIRDLIEDTAAWIIHVKLTHIWRIVEGGRTTWINMIFTDNENEMIHASIPSFFINKFGGKVQLGGHYVMKKFRLAPNVGDYRPTAHKFKIQFARTTAFNLTTSFEIQCPRFNFISYADMISDSFDSTVLRDIIAEVVIYERRNDTGSSTADFEILHDQDKIIPVRFWDNYARQFYDFVGQLTDDHPFVIIIRFAKVKVFRGSVSISNAYDVTEVLLDPKNEEALKFWQERHPTGEYSTPLTERSLNNQVCPEQLFLHSHPIKKITEIRSIEQEGLYTTYGRIGCIDPDYEWYYTACNKCSQAVSTDEEGHISCGSCKVEMQIAVPRFRVLVRVKDSGGDVLFVLFDSLVKKETHKSAREIREKQIKSGDDDSLPKELEALIGRKFVFIFKVSQKYNIEKQSKTYSVSKMTDDPDIVDKFILKMNSESGSSWTSNTTDLDCTSVCMKKIKTEESESCYTPVKRDLGLLLDEATDSITKQLESSGDSNETKSVEE